MSRRRTAICALCLAVCVSGRLVRRQGTPTAAATPSTYSAAPRAPIPEDIDVPDYVPAYAPYVYLFSQESYWPSLIQIHIDNLTPLQNSSDGIVSIPDAPANITLEDFNDSSIDGSDVYFTTSFELSTPYISNPWVLADYGKPDSSGYSEAPCIVILVNKTGIQHQDPEGDLDAFYFYFYSYNLGVNALGERFGNHVGDWEHSMVRFLNGEPQAVYVSTHDTGESYTYSAMNKFDNGQPKVWAGNGTHATYSQPGNHDYSGVPFINDFCDSGVGWNVSMNSQYFWYSPDSPGDLFVAATGTTYSPNFLYSSAQYGNAAPNSSDPYQQIVLGFQLFTAGPQGPLQHTLIRHSMSFVSNASTLDTLPTIINGSLTAVSARSAAPALALEFAPLAIAMFCLGLLTLT